MSSYVTNACMDTSSPLMMQLCNSVVNNALFHSSHTSMRRCLKFFTYYTLPGSLIAELCRCI